jgi:protein-S-isoprenylcysteine O-methyltransferase Ste14
MMARSDSNESAGVAFPPTVAYLSGLALGWLIGYVHPLRLVPDPYRWPVGVSLLLLWLVVWVVALSQFRAAATTVSTHKPVTALITSGIYRYTRNPIYVGWTLLYLGVAVIAGLGWSLVLAIPVWILMDYGVVRREEAYLERLFGGDYLEYKRRVRRWL